MNQPIDHKDEPGEHREGVFTYVRQTVGYTGSTPVGPDYFLGDWVWGFLVPGSYDQFTPFARKSFDADGSAPGKALDGSSESPNDRWVLNEDMSFSEWTYVDPMPEYGHDKPTMQEDRYHVLIKDADEFVLFNGDGSIVMIYRKA